MSEQLPPGAFYDVPADWVDWADVDEAEAAPWPPEVEADARAKADAMVAAGVFDPAKHPHRPGGSRDGGQWARTLEIAFDDGHYGNNWVFLRDPDADDPDYDRTVAKGYVQPPMQRGAVAQADFQVTPPRDGKRGRLDLGLVYTYDEERRRGHALKIIQALAEKYPQSEYEWTAENASHAGLSLLQKAVDRGILQGEFKRGSSELQGPRGPRGGITFVPTQKFIGASGMDDAAIAAGPRDRCPYCAPDEACALHQT